MTNQIINTFKNEFIMFFDIFKLSILIKNENKFNTFVEIYNNYI